MKIIVVVVSYSVLVATYSSLYVCVVVSLSRLGGEETRKVIKYLVF